MASNPNAKVEHVGVDCAPAPVSLATRRVSVVMGPLVSVQTLKERTSSIRKTTHVSLHANGTPALFQGLVRPSSMQTPVRQLLAPVSLQGPPHRWSFQERRGASTNEHFPSNWAPLRVFHQVIPA